MTTREDPEELKGKIREAALRLAKKNQWSRVSIRKISTEIGYSTIMIYSLFGSKENLFEDLREWGFSRLLDSYRKAVSRNSSEKDILLDLSEETFEFYRENRELYQIMFGIVGIPGVNNRCSPGSSDSMAAELVQDILSRILEGDAKALFMNWWALIHGYISIGSGMEESHASSIKPQLLEAVRRFLRD